MNLEAVPLSRKSPSGNIKSRLVALVITFAITSGFCASTNTPASHAAGITTDYIDAKISLDYPGFQGLSVDSLGKAHFPLIAMKAPAKPWQPAQATRKGQRVEYRRPGADESSVPRWSIEIESNEIFLESCWSADDPPEPLALDFKNGSCRATLLGLANADGSVRLPAILHLPGHGSLHISTESSDAAALSCSSTRWGGGDCRVAFSGATSEHRVRKYLLKALDIHPVIPGIDEDARFDDFRRDWLTILQMNPQLGMLANNSSSTTCGFCYYEYADIAEQTPPLAGELTAVGLIRQTLDRIIAGTNAYGMARKGALPGDAADTKPSFLIAAEDYVRASSDKDWLMANYDRIKSWAYDMLATDTNRDGLIKYGLSGNSGSWPEHMKYRPANWWDCIGFGYEDAYANALAYRALRGLEPLAQSLNRTNDVVHYRAAADRLKAAYFTNFYNPATGILAGWRSADGQLHDYYFLWVNGIAIHYGLVPEDKANAIMDRLLAKLAQVGYTNFALGLPGNLISVARKDYVDLRPIIGGGTNENNSDGFQIYENGGATACFSYFTLAALYDLGRMQDGDRILFPILQSLGDGEFQGQTANKRSKDWKSWDGMGHGYEGFLTDNYYTLFAVIDREKALKGIQKNSKAPKQVSINAN